MSSHPKFRIMILSCLKDLNKGPLSKASRYAISEKILEDFPSIEKNHHFKRNIRLSLRRLEEKGDILRLKQSFRNAPIKTNTTKNKKRLKSIAKPQKKTNNSPKKASKMKKTQKKAAPIKVIKTKRSKVIKTKATVNPKVKNVIKNIKAMNQPLPQILNTIVSSQNNLKDNQVIWQYYDKNNHNTIVKSPDGWYDYDLKASNIVEEEWQKYIKNRAMCDVRAVKSGMYNYQVDFINWTQQNLDHHAHTKRKIRRLDENLKITSNPYQ